MNNRFKPCPFCGNKEIKYEIVIKSEACIKGSNEQKAKIVIYSTSCTVCGVSFKDLIFKGAEDVAKDRLTNQWNRRV